jgi:excisionase family DNA binding protein
MTSSSDPGPRAERPGLAAPEVLEVKPVLTVAETAQLLNLCSKTIYGLVEKGVLRTLPHLRKRLITRQSIEAFIDSAGSTP